MTRPRGWIVAGLVVTLAALLVHAWVYRFLTDDAFISFRYARNFAHGHGLVFNPGFERVEGYSNFLWVILLALLDRVGLAPEVVANPLSLVATVVLWWVVVRFTLRHPPAAGAEWTMLIPPAFLAVSRSVAVWSTSGLETRAFELFAIAGLLQLAEEVDARRGSAPAGRPWGSILLGLAALTRPDGALIAFCALGAAGALVVGGPAPGREKVRGALLMTWPAFALVAALYAFRLAYYHAWAPNTYYAKVDGTLHWGAGLDYLYAFALEYGALLWLPALVAVVVGWKGSAARTPLLLFAAGLLPHVLYVIAIGGDHFEYRPLDVLFPCIAIVLYEGARAVTGSARGRLAAGALALLVLGGAFLLPWRAHVESPRSYLPGFPGLQLAEGPVLTPEATAAERFLDPDRFALTRLPLLRSWAEAHRRALRRITAYYSGIRQEEHRHFLELMRDQARMLKGAIDRGLLPPDLHVAMDCVGIVPYVTDFRTLDRLGLCDAHVAHQPFESGLMAHGKRASFAYAEERRADLWLFHPAQLVLPAASSSAMRAFSPPPAGEGAVEVAPLDRDHWIVAEFPQGAAAGRARMNKLHFWNMSDSLDVRAARTAAIGAWTASRAQRPRDTEPLDALGFLHAEDGRFDAAAEDYRALAALDPNDPDPLVNLAACLEAAKDRPGALAALRGAIERADALGDGERARALAAEAGRLATGTGGR